MLKGTHKGALVEVLNGTLVLEQTEDQAQNRRLSGVVARVDIINRNGRLYPRSAFENALIKIEADVNRGRFTGELDHPETNPFGTLERTAMVFTRLYIEGSDVRFEAKLLDTQAGQNLEALLKAGVDVGMSTRGFGTQSDQKIEGRDIKVIGEDFELFGVDAVKVPSNEAAFVQLRESLIESQMAVPEQGRKEQQVFKTLDELRAAHPDLVTEAETAATEAAQAKVTVATTELQTANEAQAAELNSIFKAVLENTEGADAKAVAVAFGTLREEIERLKTEVSEAQAAGQAAVEKAAAAELRLQLRDHFDTALAEHDFGVMLRAEIDPLAFESVEALDAEVARLTKVAQRVTEAIGRQPTGKGITGVEADEKTKITNPLLDEHTLALVADLTGKESQ